jgi:hypothetical protein
MVRYIARGFLACSLAILSTHAADTHKDLEAGFANPPNSARLRAYWWWLNGNVTKAAITRDLEEMKAKGFGGALICDAGGAEQDANDPVPHGPTFFSPEWRELYKHTLREADRLGLEMSLNILSGWNLGGPVVSADDAAKKLVWSEFQTNGPAKLAQTLPLPQSRDNYYRDLFVVAYRLKEAKPGGPVLTASSEQADHPAKWAGDGDLDSHWVSNSTEPGKGPTRQRPEWLQLAFAQPVSADTLQVKGRSGFGPGNCELQISQNGKAFRTVKTFSVPPQGAATVKFPAVSAQVFRVLFYSSFDTRYPNSPRNVQVAELQLSGKDGTWPMAISGHRPLQNWRQKAMYQALHSSAPDTTPLFQELPPAAGEEDTRTEEVVDLTSKLAPDGTLRWDMPAGSWTILRFGCTIGDHSRVSTCSEGWNGYALDVLDAGAFERYWDAVVEPLIADAGPLAGKALKYLHTDSWEVEAVNWTPSLRQEFQARRGYDLLPFLPALAGRIVNDREASNRFLADYRKTLGDLAIDHHYRIFRDRAHRHGLQIHPESGGPHAVPIDAQRCLGWDDAPMSEFWAWSWRHRVGDDNRFFVKQPASAAHTYGHPLVLAEGFTTIGPHWQETIWDNLKPSFDHALCQGLNVLVWHAFVCSPAEMGIPGQQYFAGTHFNPNSTWWPKSGAFLGYIDRCQFLLQQGLFVADVCYYYGDHVPNFTQLKRSDPAHILPGYDYDVLTEEALLTRMSVKDGRLVLPDGMSYRVLVLPDRTIISLPVLRRLQQLVADGATIIGPKPTRASGLQDFPRCDTEVATLAAQIWANCDGQQNKEHPFGKGRVISGKTARELLAADGVQPDFEVSASQDAAAMDYIHRATEGAEIYFVANRSNSWQDVRCTFRVKDKAPELWDAVSGEHHFAAAFEQKDGRTSVPLQLSPCGSCFVIFREPAAQHAPTAASNTPKLASVQDISGAWTVKFDPQWGGPAAAQFNQLVSWTTRPEPGIKYYSGTATYTKVFDLPAALRQTPEAAHLFLDLGTVHELAEVRLNGQSLGIVWAPPFRVALTGALKPTGNLLEVEVVNFWPNRIIGDQFLPAEKRFTRTNIRKLTQETALMESGLLGPVRLLKAEAALAKP